MTDSDFTKRCSACERVLSVSEFHKNRCMRDGFNNQCKTCRKKYSSVDWPSVREYHAVYRETNRERVSTRIREHYAKNPEPYKKRARRWERANPVRAQELKNAWARANKEKTAEKNRRYRARRQDADGSHTAVEVWLLAESQDWLCAYCEAPLFGRFEIDHMMPLSRGGADGWENLAISCPSCNHRKGARTAEEFWNEVLQICHLKKESGSLVS